jgi:hypothetical protein
MTAYQMKSATTKDTSKFLPKLEIVGYLNLKNRKPPMTTNEKQATRSTTKIL